MNFFDDGLGHEQFRIGLVIAATALSSALCAIVTLAIPHGVPVDWTEVGAGFGAIGVVIAYVIVKYAVVARNSQVVLDPRIVLALVIACVVTVSLVNVAGDGPSWAYEPIYVEIPVFVALIGNSTMRRVTLVATVVGMALSTWTVVPHRGGATWTSIVMFAFVLATVESMVATIMTTLRGRNSARGAINAMMQAAATSETLLDGLATCLPLVDGVVSAHRAAVVERSASSGATAVVAGWTRSTLTPGGRTPGSLTTASTGLDPAFTDLADGTHPDLAAALVSPTAVVTDRWCCLPIGYTATGELALVVERDRPHGYGARFAHETADAVTAAFLRLTARLAHLARLHEESVTDPVTGLANRRHLMKVLDLELARSARTGQALAVAMLDLDHFKACNDTHGHLAADEVLERIGRLLNQRVRSGDLAARYGGDEFCLVLPATGVSGAHALVESIRQQVGACVPGSGVTLSAGIACWDGQSTGAVLLAEADARLYAAKRAGRDTVVSSAPDRLPVLPEPSMTPARVYEPGDTVSAAGAQADG
ncbi:MAG: GGDEF domain-containing protein [Actinomycetota bacterium]|nr:GGDEF domain-containing protein [Actinomycetota bacterium]